MSKKKTKTRKHGKKARKAARRAAPKKRKPSGKKRRAAKRRTLVVWRCRKCRCLNDGRRKACWHCTGAK